jgi:hypothetical protein
MFRLVENPKNERHPGNLRSKLSGIQSALAPREVKVVTTPAVGHILKPSFWEKPDWIPDKFAKGQISRDDDPNFRVFE